MSGDSPTRTATPKAWPWPDALDALAAAPDHHLWLMENEHVRVLETRIPAGDTVPLHTHRWPAVYHVLKAGDCVRRDGEGNVLIDTRKTPAAGGAETARVVWSEALPPHTLENVGREEIHLISVELKGAGY